MVVVFVEVVVLWEVEVVVGKYVWVVELVLSMVGWQKWPWRT